MTSSLVPECKPRSDPSATESLSVTTVRLRQEVGEP